MHGHAGVVADKLRSIFDEDADLYDRSRPDYPPALFADLVDVTGFGAESTVVEIGPGGVRYGPEHAFVRGIDNRRAGGPTPAPVHVKLDIRIGHFKIHFLRRPFGLPLLRAIQSYVDIVEQEFF